MEKIVLSAMVDAHGDLYFFMPNMAENFTGAFWLGKVLASKDTEVKSCTVYIDQELRRNFGGEGYYWNWNEEEKRDTALVKWHAYAPCIAQETTFNQDCCYHTDMQVMQHNGKNLALVMSLVKISHMSGAGISADSNKCWTDDKFVPWNKNYIALVISSWYEGSGFTNIDIPPDNIIEVFPVSTASNAETTSTSTLYKNTYKFVTYTKGAYNYIIYAYCYPGKSKQLYLGACRYWFDSNGHVHLYTKREFRNKKGESFSNLTNCSRIIHMDVKNGHLWAVFMSTDGKKIYYFHAKVDDIVKFAP